MANRGFPLSGDDGKPHGFPHHPMNGGYPGMYYPNQDVVMPYNPYSSSPCVPFAADNCAVPQNAGEPLYGYDTQSYLQQYRQHQANMMNYQAAAAYNQQAMAARLTNPQQIADSIYMAAHAYSYQHQSQQQNMNVNYNPVALSNSNLSVRTTTTSASSNGGAIPSPAAASIHSPSGSSHSMGERPMLSPRVQPSNASGYQYSHSNQNPGLLPPHSQFYSNGHVCKQLLGIDTAEPRRSLERLASISTPATNDPEKSVTPVKAPARPAQNGILKQPIPNQASAEVKLQSEPTKKKIQSHEVCDKNVSNSSVISANNKEDFQPKESKLISDNLPSKTSVESELPNQHLNGHSAGTKETIPTSDTSSKTNVVQEISRVLTPEAEVTKQQETKDTEKVGRNAEKEASKSLQLNSVREATKDQVTDYSPLPDNITDLDVASPGADVLSCSSTSKNSINDESKLPPRKRKQQLSEHTSPVTGSTVIESVPVVSIPLKKRGRPSKEMVRLREAAKMNSVNPATKQRKYSISNKERPTIKPSSNDGSPENDTKQIEKLEIKITKDKLVNSSPEKLNGAQSLLKLDSEPKVLLTSQTDILQTMNDAAIIESSAVKVSPPKKPKASVLEMQKALMKVVISSTPDCSFSSGKRRRGRPPGSKNKKTLSLVRTLKTAIPQSVLKVETQISPTSKKHSSLESSKTSHVMTLPISPKYIAQQVKPLPSSDSDWACVFCGHIANYRDMGDLYGGYIVHPGAPLPTKVHSSKKSASNPPAESEKTASEGCMANEVWFHERCIVWAPGVNMVAGKINGVYEAIQTTLSTKCTACNRAGAVIGCYYKGCSHRYHIPCADISDCLLVEENFSMLCPLHKDKKIVLL